MCSSISFTTISGARSFLMVSAFAEGSSEFDISVESVPNAVRDFSARNDDVGDFEGPITMQNKAVPVHAARNGGDDEEPESKTVEVSANILISVSVPNLVVAVAVREPLVAAFGLTINTPG